MPTITGTTGNDALIGTNDADTINPLVGADTVDGLGGSDTLIADYSAVVWDPFGGASVPGPTVSTIVSTGASFSGNIRVTNTANVTYSNVEHLQVKLDFWHNIVILDGAALAQGATISLDGGNGSDTLDADFSALASVNLQPIANGLTASFGTIVNFETFLLKLTAGDDNVTTGAGNDVVSGGAGSNIINTGAGNDTITSIGIDTVDGGSGLFNNDRWNGNYGASTADLVFTHHLANGAGTLSNGASVTGIEFVNLTTGSGNDVITFTNPASAFDSFMVAAGAGEDSLTFTGGASSSLLSADGAGAFAGNIGGGQFSGIEHLTFVAGGGADMFTVNAAPLLAGATLSLDGGGGTDRIVIDLTAFAGLSFVVAPDGSLTTSVPATLLNFETYWITTGAGIDTITTGAGNDEIRANGGNDILVAGAGNDLIDGGSGADSMTGGDGNDIYVLDDAGDTVAENAAEGIDEIRTAFASFSLASLANFENLTGTATTGQTLTGNGSSNVIAGGSGDDVIDGGAGADTMNGGNGSDLYYVDDIGDVVTDFGTGTDEVRTSLASYSLGSFSSIEILRGTVDTGQTLTGSDNANQIIGGGGDDVINGGFGADTMTGGAGNDRYTVDHSGDTVTENADEGIDEISTFLTSYTLGANVEKLTGTGFNQALTGNALDNVITAAGFDDQLDGGIGADTMTGGAGNDRYTIDNVGDVAVELADQGVDEVRTDLSSYTLGDHFENLTGTSASGQTLTGNARANVIVGASGADTMAGGAGDDSYTVDNAGDSVVELDGGGLDGVRTTVSVYALGDHVENLFGISASGHTLTGNALDNLIVGFSGIDILNGGIGADTLNGAGGADTMSGGEGNDLYVVDNAGDVVIELDGQGVDEVRTTRSSYALGNHVENLTGTSFAAQTLTGNALGNAITGGSSNDVLLGGLGADALNGGPFGTDTASYADFAAAVFVNLNIGQGFGNHAQGDTYAGIENVIGSSEADFIIGDSGANRLDGGGGDDLLVGSVGADALVGGAGADTASYEDNWGAVFVNLNTGQGFGNAAQGDTYSGIENLNGSIFDDVLIGNGAANRLDGGGGNDSLVGGNGADILVGGAGTDTASYEDNNGGAFVNLTLGQGFGNSAQGDTYSGIENLMGSIFDDFFIGDDGSNRLDGGGGNDILTGSVGADTLVGGAGADTASYEDNWGAVFVNLTTGQGFGNAAQGDTYEGIENLNGSIFDDFFIGDASANRLAGRLGADTLVGAGGADSFLFDTALGAGNVDTITDFVSGSDTILLDDSVFAGLGLGALAAGAFVVGAAAADGDDRIVYDQATGALLFDADGSGLGAAVQFATLQGAPVIASSDFMVI